MDRIQELRRKEWNMPLSRRVAETLLSYDAEYRTLSIEARGNEVAEQSARLFGSEPAKAAMAAFLAKSKRR